MVSFDVKSLFTNVPSDRNIRLALKRIYEKHETFISLLMKRFINNRIVTRSCSCRYFYGWTWKNIVPVLQEKLSLWKRYVDDTICFVKIGTINYITKILNNFDPNIKFTYEVEKDCKLPFLDVLLIKTGNNIFTTI